MTHFLRHFLRRHCFQHRIILHNLNPLPNKPINPQIHAYSSLTSSTPPNPIASLIRVFSEPDPKAINEARADLLRNVSILKEELLKHRDDTESIHTVLRDSGSPLFSRHFDGSAMVELLEQISDFPQLALEVFEWRSKHADLSFPISREEYSKGIKVAGQLKNVSFAKKMFTEADNNQCKSFSTYNALMSVYMRNNLPDECQAVFREFKKERNCSPNIMTYNILLAAFGRLMLTDHMEATFQEIRNSRLIPNVHTFNNMIAGYLTAWMWDKVENTYLIMNEASIRPDTYTYKLMVRGYAHSGNLKKMEEMYALLKQLSNEDDFLLICNMILAYCKSSCINKINYIETLLKLLPEGEYTSWVIVHLIRVYARENQLDKMEEFIHVALKKEVVVTSLNVMCSISAAYFHHKAVDKLSRFVKLADGAKWRLCRSLYHCKMIMYGLERRLEEMEAVREEMEKVNIDNRTIKCLIILCHNYSKWGVQCKLKQVIGLMLKLGYDVRVEEHDFDLLST